MERDEKVKPFTKVIVKNLWWIIWYLPRFKYMYRHPEKYTEQQFYALAMQCVNWAMKSSTGYPKAYGLENLPEGGCLLCSNHQDKLDPLAIWLTYPGSCDVVIADKVMHYPLVPIVIRSLGAIVMQKNSLKAMYQMSVRVQERLEQDHSVMLFPEGDYEENVHQLSPFMAGGFRAPLRAKKPIVPVVLIDSSRALERNRREKMEIQVHYLKPVMPEEYEGMSTSEISDLVAQRIQAVIDELQQ